MWAMWICSITVAVVRNVGGPVFCTRKSAFYKGASKLKNRLQSREAWMFDNWNNGWRGLGDLLIPRRGNIQ